MAGPTRQRYIKYEIAARRSDKHRVQKDALRRWNGWSKQARADLIAHFGRVQDAAAVVERALEAQRQAYRAAETAMERELALKAQTVATAISKTIAASHAISDEAYAAIELQRFLEALYCPVKVIQRARAAAEKMANEVGPKRAALHAPILQLQSWQARTKAQCRDWPQMQQQGQRCPKEVEVDEFLDPKDLVDNGWIRQPQLGQVTDSMSVQSVFEGDWTGPFLLFEGNPTIVTLYVQLDQQGITRRVVRKDIIVGHNPWRCFTKWDGDIRDVKTRVHIEAACHVALTGAQAHLPSEQRTFLGLLQHGIDNRRQTVTLFTEFAEYGTVEDLITAYRQRVQHVPEPFVWCLLETLVKCGLVMQFGTDQLDQGAEDWHEIVHGDIKPDNIFLGEPNLSCYGGYPAPKLGDFGNACRTFKDDPANPDMLADGLGTDGYRAPEVTKYIDRRIGRPLHREKLGAHSNVYSMGRTLLAVMMARWSDEMRDPDFTDYCRNYRPIRIGDRQQLASRYSQSLISIVERCLAFLPAHRPSYQTLSNETTELMALNGHNALSDADRGRLDTVRALRDGTAQQHISTANELRYWGPRWTMPEQPLLGSRGRFAIGADITHGGTINHIMTARTKPEDLWQ